MPKCEVCGEREALRGEPVCSRCRYAIGCAEAEMQAHMAAHSPSLAEQLQEWLQGSIYRGTFGHVSVGDYFTGSWSDPVQYGKPWYESMLEDIFDDEEEDE